jgi:hypothetical protein
MTEYNGALDGRDGEPDWTLGCGYKPERVPEAQEVILDPPDDRLPGYIIRQVPEGFELVEMPQEGMFFYEVTPGVFYPSEEEALRALTEHVTQKQARRAAFRQGLLFRTEDYEAGKVWTWGKVGDGYGLYCWRIVTAEDGQEDIEAVLVDDTVYPTVEALVDALPKYGLGFQRPGPRRPPRPLSQAKKGANDEQQAVP